MFNTVSLTFYVSAISHVVTIETILLNVKKKDFCPPEQKMIPV